MGNRTPISRKLQHIRRLEGDGAEVLVLCADVAHEADMQAAFAQIEARFGALHGVFHAAGITQGTSHVSPVVDIGRTASEEQFHAKGRGVQILAHLLRDKTLDFCLLFSSINAVLGGPGRAAYAAANLFMGAFTTTQNRISATPWICVDWDGWQLLDASSPEEARARGLAQYAITPAEGLDALQRVVTNPTVGQVIVSAGDLLGKAMLWQQRHTVPDTEPITDGTVAGTLHQRPMGQETYVAPRDEIERSVASLWQELLGIEHVGIHDDFFELGGHSLLATQLVAHLRATFQLDLALRHFFNAPTVAEISEVIVQSLAEQIDDETLAALDQLSS